MTNDKSTNENMTPRVTTCVMVESFGLDLVLTIYNEGVYLTVKPIFHKGINLF